MCGRYVLADGEILGERFIARQVPLNIPLSFNVAPTQQMPVVVERDDEGRVVDLMRWGLTPRWGRDRPSATLFNARAETVAEKPTFRRLVGTRRCLVPASGFYEWTRQGGGPKRPFYFTVHDEPLFAFAGLYDEQPDDSGELIAAYTILTTRPNDLLAQYHDRMPVILRPEHEAAWLSLDLTDPTALEPFYEPFPAERMATKPVSSAVNNVRNNDPSLITPLTDEHA